HFTRSSRREGRRPSDRLNSFESSCASCNAVSFIRARSIAANALLCRGRNRGFKSRRARQTTTLKGEEAMELKDIVTFGMHDEATLTQIRRSASHEAVTGATLCADGHKGYAVPIGGVLAYEEHISPSGVGFDIACGNKAVLTDADAAGVRANIKTIMDDVWKTL